MFFNQPEIIKILQKEYHWDDAEIHNMNYVYTNAIIKLILDETMLYIERHNLPEQAELVELLHKSKATRGGIETEVALVKYVASIPNKYPKLIALLEQKITEVDESLAEDLISGLSQSAGEEILKIINSDLDKMQNFQERFLALKPQQ